MKHERGQALILLVIGVVAIAGVVGLAIDGGRLYTQRRQVQNAADAASMAGGQILADYITGCEAGTVENDNVLAQAVLDIARNNGVDYNAPEGHFDAWYVDANETRLGQVGYGGGIPNGTTGIELVASKTENATFLKVVGQQNIQSSASAVVMVGPLEQLPGGTGILPIALYDGVVQELEVGEEFAIYDDGTYCRDVPCEFDDSAPASLHGWLNMGYIYNEAYWTPGGNGPLERTVVKNVGNSGCSWNGGAVDVAGTGLKGWASGQCPYPNPIFAGPEGSVNGDFIHGDPGMRTASIKAVKDGYPPGSTAYVPIFDYVYDPGTMDATFDEPSIGWVTGGGGINAAYFHIIGFATVELTEIQPGGGDKHISGNFVEANYVVADITPGSGIGTCSGDLLTGLTLWR